MQQPLAKLLPLKATMAVLLALPGLAHAEDYYQKTKGYR